MTNTVNLPVNEDYMTPREAAEYLGVSTQRIYVLTKDEQLDSYRPWPRKVLITRASIEAWKRGERKPKESIRAAKAYVEARIDVPIGMLPVSRLSDLVYDYITDLRPDWHRSESGRWAEQATHTIVRGADVPR